MKKILIALIAVILLGLAAFGIYKFTNTKDETIMNNGYVNGNTAGNLYNGGAFCEYNGTIFFSNPSDRGKLYSMDSNGKNLKKLADDIPTYINADENYVYSFRSGSQNNIADNYIFVNDWDGNIVAEILVDLPTEAENIFRVGNMWYTGYYSSGGIVYETIMYKVID